MSNISRKLKKHSKTSQKSTVSNNQKSIRYAYYIDRIKAFITDMFMIYTPILYAITYVVLGTKEEFQHSTLGPLAAVVLYGIIYAAFISKTGQTPGKKAYQIKVVKADTKELLSPTMAFFRFFAFSVSAMSIIGVLLPFYNKEKRALHDYLVGSIEIEIPEEASKDVS